MVIENKIKSKEMGKLGNNQLLHIFRNIPFGKETLLHSIDFCRKLDLKLTIYTPRTKKFLMYFSQNTLEVNLDASYVKYPQTAREHAEAVLEYAGYKATFIEPETFTASSLPDLPTDIDFMTCPRVISDLSAKGPLSIGAGVREILRRAPFPVLIPIQGFQDWKSVAVLFGGSRNGLRALNIGINIAKASGLPLDVFTQSEKNFKRSDYEEIVERHHLTQDLQDTLRKWEIYEGGEFIDNLFYIPHDALIVMGIFGYGLVKDKFFGNIAETVQSSCANTLLLAGPEMRKDYWRHVSL